MRDRTIFLVGAKCLFWVFFLVVYVPILAGGHARDTFGVSRSDADHIRAACEVIGSCGENHDAFVLAQAMFMRVVAGEIWATGVILLILETMALVIGIRHIAGRIPGRAVIRWKVQLVVVVLTLAIYVAMLAIGARGLQRIPYTARLVPFEDAFSSPFADPAMISYIAVLVVVGAFAVTHNRALARRLGAHETVETEPADLERSPG